MCDQTEMDNTLFNTTFARPDLMHYPYGNYPPQARSVENDIDINCSSSGNASSNGTESLTYDPVSLSNDWSTSLHRPSSSVSRFEPCYRHCRHNHHAQVYISCEAPRREPCSVRPSYNEEAKFFIIYYRMVKQLS
jgi:hypothetical protein